MLAAVPAGPGGRVGQPVVGAAVDDQDVVRQLRGDGRGLPVRQGQDDDVVAGQLGGVAGLDLQVGVRAAGAAAAHRGVGRRSTLACTPVRRRLGCPASSRHTSPPAYPVAPVTPTVHVCAPLTMHDHTQACMAVHRGRCRRRRPGPDGTGTPVRPASRASSRGREEPRPPVPPREPASRRSRPGHRDAPRPRTPRRPRCRAVPAAHSVDHPTSDTPDRAIASRAWPPRAPLGIRRRQRQAGAEGGAWPSDRPSSAPTPGGRTPGDRCGVHRRRSRAGRACSLPTLDQRVDVDALGDGPPAPTACPHPKASASVTLRAAP